MSSSNPPPAAGVRVHWDGLPASIRKTIEERLEGKVVDAITQPGGFSPGLAARLRLDDGRWVFVKAVSELANPDTPTMHRREARIVAALPPSSPVPRLLWTYDDAGGSLWRSAGSDSARKAVATARIGEFPRGNGEITGRPTSGGQSRALRRCPAPSPG